MRSTTATRETDHAAGEMTQIEDILSMLKAIALYCATPGNGYRVGEFEELGIAKE